MTGLCIFSFYESSSITFYCCFDPTNFHNLLSNPLLQSGKPLAAAVLAADFKNKPRAEGVKWAAKSSWLSRAGLLGLVSWDSDCLGH